MDDTLVQYLIGVAVTAAVALLWKVDRAVARHNGALSHVIEEQARVATQLLRENTKIDDVRDEQRRVADALLTSVLAKVVP